MIVNDFNEITNNNYYSLVLALRVLIFNIIYIIGHYLRSQCLRRNPGESRDPVCHLGFAQAKDVTYLESDFASVRAAVSPGFVAR